MTRLLLPALVLLLHGSTLVAALWQHTYLWDDSVQYLTLAHNWTENGTYSQDYSAPLYPDIQRPPAYALLLILLGQQPWLILLVQHGLVLLTARMLYLGLKQDKPLAARLAGWGYALMPYPALFGSTILSDVLFLAAVVGAWYSLQRGTLRWAAVAGGALALALLTKGLAMVAVPALLLYLTLKRQWRPLGITVGVCMLTLLPWQLYKHHSLTTPSGAGISYIYGQLGGSLHRYNDDRHLVVQTDSLLIARGLPLHHLRQYSGPHMQEYATLHPEAARIAASHWVHHPGSALLLLARSQWQMWKGIGWRSARRLWAGHWPAYVLAGLQALYNVAILLGCLAFVLLLRYRWHWWLWLGLTLGLALLVGHSAAWADGRYRLVADPLLWAIASVAWTRIYAGRYPATVATDTP